MKIIILKSTKYKRKKKTLMIVYLSNINFMYIFTTCKLLKIATDQVILVFSLQTKTQL